MRIRQIGRDELARRASRLEQLLEQALADCLSPWNLTQADFGVLSALRIAGAPYELRPTDIRKRLLLTSGGVSNVLNRLEQMGLADRIPDLNDGRSSRVRLTDTGIAVAERTAHAWAAAEDRFFSGLSPKLARQAADTLRAVLLAVGDREPAPAAARGAGPITENQAGYEDPAWTRMGESPSPSGVLRGPAQTGD